MPSITDCRNRFRLVQFGRALFDPLFQFGTHLLQFGEMSFTLILLFEQQSVGAQKRNRQGEIKGAEDAGDRPENDTLPAVYIGKDSGNIRVDFKTPSISLLFRFLIGTYC